MARLKPLPKFIMIAAVAGGVVYGVKVGMDSGLFKRSTPAPITEVVQQPAVVQTITAPTEVTPVQPQQVAPPVPQPQPSTAGMSKLLESGRR